MEIFSTKMLMESIHRALNLGAHLLILEQRTIEHSCPLWSIAVTVLSMGHLEHCASVLSPKPFLSDGNLVQMYDTLTDTVTQSWTTDHSIVYES